MYTRWCYGGRPGGSGKFPLHCTGASAAAYGAAGTAMGAPLLSLHIILTH